MKTAAISDRVLDARTLDEATERELLSERGGRGVVAPYRIGEVRGAPVVFVHGYKDSPQCFAPLADAFCARSDHSPYVFLYDDVGRYIDRIGDDLARALVALAARHRAASGNEPALRVVAHSMGGIVARCALNSLADPRWFPRLLPDPETGEMRPVRGTGDDAVADIRLAESHAGDFSRVDLVAIDTPWHGYANPPIDVRNSMEEEGSFVDMVSNSAVFTHLHAVKLPAHFAVNYIEADNVAAGASLDSVMGLGELTEEAFSALSRHFAGEADALAGLPKVKNLLAALASEQDYPRLDAALRDAAARGALDPARLAQIAAEFIPRLPGSHTSVLEHPALFDEVWGTFERARANGA